jgi:hypothetical protein
MCAGLLVWVRDRFWADGAQVASHAAPHIPDPKARTSVHPAPAQSGPDTSPCVSPESSIVKQAREINGWDEV